MKSILMFFFVIFVALSAGVYFYETQIASPSAADALVKSKKNKLKKKVTKAPPIIKKPSLTAVKTEDTMTTSAKASRVVDLAVLKETDNKDSKKRKDKQREIEKSIRSTIKKSISLEIQKAVVMEISKKR